MGAASVSEPVGHALEGVWLALSPLRRPEGDTSPDSPDCVGLGGGDICQSRLQPSDPSNPCCLQASKTTTATELDRLSERTPGCMGM